MEFPPEISDFPQSLAGDCLLNLSEQRKWLEYAKKGNFEEEKHGEFEGKAKLEK